MHDLEPFHQWRDMYIASDDAKSPFYKRQYSEFKFTHKVYNYFIHPQWDAFGSTTLYTKILFVDYEQGFAILEFIGEWNDTLHDDMMLLKRNVLEVLMEECITQFVFICDNLLNFHSGDDDYYRELYEELHEAVPAGWVVFVNTRQHVFEEMEDGRLAYYVAFGEEYNDINWRALKPIHAYEIVAECYQDRRKRLY